MTKLRFQPKHKRFIVQSLACFMSPSEVVEAVKDEFKPVFDGVDISRQAVEAYDPTKTAGESLSEDLKKLFEETRDDYINRVEKLGISHQAYRLERLQRMVTRMEGMGNFIGAAQLLEQAAKDIGGAFTNRRELTGKGGKDLPPLNIILNGSGTP